MFGVPERHGLCCAGRGFFVFLYIKDAAFTVLFPLRHQTEGPAEGHRLYRLLFLWHRGERPDQSPEKQGRDTLPLFVQQKYGQSLELRFIHGTFLLPISYIQTKPPKNRPRNGSVYTPEGRAEIHKSLEAINTEILHYMMKNPVQGESIEYNDNRLSLYCAQQGKCAITGDALRIGEIHCHHKTRRADSGDDRYENLVLVCQDAHILIHAVKENTIRFYREKLALNCKQMDKLNRLRNRLNLPTI